MDDALLDEVLHRLDRDEVDTDVQLLVLATCEGDTDLAAALRDEPVDIQQRGELADATQPAGAFLTGVTVEGFRGVGERATLKLAPGPGLTLVVGRNGSGKSSFAEALEVLLTGDNQRWSQRSKAWQEGWRNLHHDGETVITAEFAEEGLVGSTLVRRRWPPGVDLDDAQTTVQRHGRPLEGLDSLGWRQPLATFRPFLSYNELGSMLDEGPSKLYDALKAILGLDDLTAASERLRQARLERERHHKGVKSQLDLLLPQLAELDEERARACHAALAGRRWDLGTVEASIMETGDAPPTEELTALRALASIDAPDAARATTVARGLRAAAEQRDAVARTDAARAHHLAQMLEEAVAFHAAHGDNDCPVCGQQDALGSRWAQQARAQAAALRREAGAVEEADQAVQLALQRAGELVDLPPRLLHEHLPFELDRTSAQRDWQHWWDGAQTDDPVALSEHIEHSLPPLAESVAELRDTAAAELQRRQDVWRPLARQLASWLTDALDAEVAAEKIPQLKAAEGWLTDAIADLRDRRFQPIAERTQAVWEMLRTRSNVELGRVHLEGSGTRRRVGLEVAVDGVEGAALGVMSQGELHSLALSLFLPRATVDESPLRFLVIDDPVQSMDPARVEGLAAVLAEVADDRQVIVFTHDDRLPEAVRRLQLAATVLEVTRRPGSRVEVRSSSDPVERLLDDGRALASTDDLPTEIAQRVVPGFCRAALEAACLEVVRRRRLGRGDPHATVEAALADATALTAKMALAIFDDPGRGSEVLRRCNALAKGGATTLQQCQRGTHSGFAGSLHHLVDDTAELVRGVRRQ